jgi:hypothetical protein
MDNHEDALGSQPYVLPRDLIGAAQDTSWELSRSLEEISGRYLTHRQVTAISFEDGATTVKLGASEIARFLGQLRPLAMDSATPAPPRTPEIKFGSTTAKSVLRFIELFLEELRGIICKGGKSLSTTTKGALVAVASWLAAKFGVLPHIATAVATAILVAALTATKGAFCKMTAEQAKAALAASAISDKR